jgi:hypothetical protein
MSRVGGGLNVNVPGALEFSVPVVQRHIYAAFDSLSRMRKLPAHNFPEQGKIKSLKKRIINIFLWFSDCLLYPAAFTYPA